MNSPRRKGRAMIAILFIGIILYLGTAVAFAAYLLYRAFSQGVGDFEKVAIGALIAVLGTGLTALAALYTANRQAAAAREVEFLRSEMSKDLAQIASKLNADLETLKAQAAQSLERLKAYLDAEKIAHRELCGAAAIYFYALRSAALGSWDDQLLKKAEAGMIEATRHLIYVGDKMRSDWLTFWQEAQHIYRTALAEPDEGNRTQLINTNISEKVQDGSSRLDLRDRYDRLEGTARGAIKEEMGMRNLPS